MFKMTYNTQPKDELLGGLLLAASVCWTIAALTFLPATNNAPGNELATRAAAPISIAKVAGAEGVMQSHASLDRRIYA